MEEEHIASKKQMNNDLEKEYQAIQKIINQANISRIPVKFVSTALININGKTFKTSGKDLEYFLKGDVTNLTDQLLIDAIVENPIVEINLLINSEKIRKLVNKTIEKIFNDTFKKVK